jgi:hypothetical protein
MLTLVLRNGYGTYQHTVILSTEKLLRAGTEIRTPVTIEIIWNALEC